MAADDDSARALAALAAVCEDAVRAHGSDWSKIKAAVDSYLAGLHPADRLTLDRAANETARPGDHPRQLH